MPRTKSKKPFFKIYDTSNGSYELRDFNDTVILKDKPLQDLKMKAAILIATEHSYKNYQKTPRRLSYIFEGDKNLNTTTDNINVSIPKEYSVRERFEMMESIVNMCIDNLCSGTIICGAPAVGKSYLVLKCCERKKLVEGEDYVIISGKTTAIELYKSLYDHNNKLIIYDDCDSALFKQDCVDLLKKGLDTTGRRVIHYHSNSIRNDENYESEFEFSGRIIFISNKNKFDVDEAILSRAMCIDLAFDVDDLLEHITHLAPIICDGLANYQIDEILEFLEENKHEVDELNLRTLIKLKKLYISSKSWKKMAKFMWS